MGGWVVDKSKLMLNSTQVENGVEVGVELVKKIDLWKKYDQNCEQNLLWNKVFDKSCEQELWLSFGNKGWEWEFKTKAINKNCW